MFSSTLVSLVLSPLLIAAAPTLLADHSSQATHFLQTRQSSYNASLPNITIFATGGTIAGSAGSSTAVTGYTAGALGIQVLIDAVPSIVNISNVNGVQVSNVDSGSITPTILLNLTQQVTAALADPYIQGVVITHGTDTLEETAFFMDLTTRSEKPVVVVGAMRPATAISADGPINLLAAVTLAASPAAVGRGTMVVLNDRIASAYYTTKTNANALDTFRAVEQGFLGVFLSLEPVFYYAPALPVGKPYFDVSETAELPQVDILYGYQQLNPALVEAAVESGSKGLIMAGMGAGGWTTAGRAAADEAYEKNGTIFVWSHRSQDGFVDGGYEHAVGSGFFNPQKSRYLLSLALNAGWGLDQLKTVFK
ncbi:L-asparaginase 1 [Phlyctema vagabunda]|uniref:asparaginase n=1 Tax=Phlyctema vagabunda TaxID=108571 RepID=A0ABR4PSW9_9HELO